jgi:hypothetical protein
MATPRRALGQQDGPRNYDLVHGFADTLIGDAAVGLYAAFGGASSRSWEIISICPFFRDMGRPIVHRQG